MTDPKKKPPAAPEDDGEIEDDEALDRAIDEAIERAREDGGEEDGEDGPLDAYIRQALRNAGLEDDELSDEDEASDGEAGTTDRGPMADGGAADSGENGPEDDGPESEAEAAAGEVPESPALLPDEPAPPAEPAPSRPAPAPLSEAERAALVARLDELWQPVSVAPKPDFTIDPPGERAVEVPWWAAPSPHGPDLGLPPVEAPDAEIWDTLATGQGPPGRQAPIRPALELPSWARRVGASPSPPRLIPWRLQARHLRPDLGRRLVVANPASAETTLAVAAFGWKSAEALWLRLDDDSAEIVVPAIGSTDARMEFTLRIADRVIDGSARLVASQGERGFFLGRDVLAGRFTVDPARELEPEDD